MQKPQELYYQGEILRGMYHPVNTPPGKTALHGIIFHGFTGNKVDEHCLHVRLSRFLAQRNVAVARYDFLGSGESDGDFSRMTLSGEVSQAKEILHHTLGLTGGDPSKIILIGHSMGALVASLLAGDVAKETGSSVGALVLIAPAANMVEILETRIEDNKAWKMEDGSVDLDGYPLGTRLLSDVREIFHSGTFVKRLAFYKGPVHIIHGTADDTVPVEKGREFAGYYTQKVWWNPIPGAGHTFARISYEKQLMESLWRFLDEVFKLTS